MKIDPFFISAAQIMEDDVFGRFVATKKVIVVKGSSQVELTNLILDGGIYTLSWKKTEKRFILLNK